MANVASYQINPCFKQTDIRDHVSSVGSRIPKFGGAGVPDAMQVLFSAEDSEKSRRSGNGTSDVP